LEVSAESGRLAFVGGRLRREAGFDADDAVADRGERVGGEIVDWERRGNEGPADVDGDGCLPLVARRRWDGSLRGCRQRVEQFIAAVGDERHTEQADSEKNHIPAHRSLGSVSPPAARSGGARDPAAEIVTGHGRKP
jgi:hypothetical protein